MRAGLADDPGLSRCRPMAGQYSVLAGLDDDLGCGCGCWSGGGSGDGSGPGDGDPDLPPGGDPTAGLPVLTIRERTRTYYEADGAPRYEWTDLLTGPTLALEQRVEINDATGQTRVTATAVIAYDGDDPPDETAVAVDSRGWRWDITSCRSLPDRLELALERISDVD